MAKTELLVTVYLAWWWRWGFLPAFTVYAWLGLPINWDFVNGVLSWAVKVSPPPKKKPRQSFS